MSIRRILATIIVSLFIVHCVVGIIAALCLVVVESPLVAIAMVAFIGILMAVGWAMSELDEGESD